MQPKKTNHPFDKLDAYKKTDIMTANKETILLMLYESAIRALKSALNASEEKNLAERNRLIQKTQEIVSELRSTLNFSVGKEIAQNLDSLYAFVSQRLLEGSLDNNMDFIKEALQTLETLYSAWNEAVAILRKQQNESINKNP